MIQVQDLTKSYGGQVLFDGVSFNINRGERIGLTGRNGSGKTTLLRVLTGAEEADSGRVSVPRGYTIGMMEQNIRFSQSTVLEEACLGLRPEEKNDAWKAEKVLSGLGFSAADMERHPSVFSGGFQVRINLAKVIANTPDLLLLDEPTNFLDIVSIRWLVRFLNGWKGELVLITHDRGFMDSVTTHTMALHRRKVRKIEGKTDRLYGQILQEEEVYEKTRVNDEKKRREVELFITRFRAKARLGGLVQSRVKTLQKAEKKERLDRLPELDFSFRALPFESKWLMDARDVSFSYGGGAPYLIDRFSIAVGKSDRIAVIGKNGRGKTTLLRLLNGELSAISGSIDRHPQLKMSYFGQTNIERLNPYNTVEEELYQASQDRPLARAIAGTMLFEGDAALKKVSVLSGGEKSRVLLGKILAAPSHVLLLDEPTNHLDMESCDALVSALDGFGGAVVIVTHNEMFLHALANRFIVFTSKGLLLYEGSYQGFLDDVGWEEELLEREQERERRESEGPNRKDVRRARSEVIAEKSRALKPLEKEMRVCEESIQRLEAELHGNNAALIGASTAGDGAKIAALSKKNHELVREIEGLYDRFDKATARYEAASAEYERRLSEIDG